MTMQLLRHRLSYDGLNHDHFGLVEMDALAKQIQDSCLVGTGVEPAELLDQVLKRLCEEERVEIRGTKIRALYGHSLPGVLVGKLEWPDQPLLHVTRERYAGPILKNGLFRRSRSYVHLTTSLSYAMQILVGRGCASAILKIEPNKIDDEDVYFRKPNSHVWLANRIPPSGIRRISPKEAERDFANQT